jgi:hypothetical protein
MGVGGGHACRAGGPGRCLRGHGGGGGGDEHDDPEQTAGDLDSGVGSRSWHNGDVDHASADDHDADIRCHRAGQNNPRRDNPRGGRTTWDCGADRLSSRDDGSTGRHDANDERPFDSDPDEPACNHLEDRRGSSSQGRSEEHPPFHRGACAGRLGRIARLGLPGVGAGPLAGPGAALDGRAGALDARGELPRLGHVGGVQRLGTLGPLRGPLSGAGRSTIPSIDDRSAYFLPYVRGHTAVGASLPGLPSGPLRCNR